MNTKKILENIDAKEVSKSFVLPVKFTDEQQKKAAEQLSSARKRNQARKITNDVLALKILQLRFQVEDYINSNEYNPKKNFATFLKTYLSIANKRSVDLAKEIDVHKSLISQLINNTREPNESLMVRLELHSNNNIPATYWFRIVQKDKVHELSINRQLRQQEKKHVSKKLDVVI
jgi:hypothetical protein